MSKLPIFGLLLFMLSACDTSTQLLYVDDLTSSTDSVHLEVGGQSEVTVTPRDSRGNPLLDRSDYVRWTTSNDGVLVVPDSSSGVTLAFSALKVGSSSVRAELGRGVVSIPVYVSAAGLDEIRLPPSPLEIPRFETVSVPLLLVAEDGSILSNADFRVSWEFDTPDLVFLSSGTQSADLRGFNVGRGQLKVIVSGRSESIEVVIR